MEHEDQMEQKTLLLTLYPATMESADLDLVPNLFIDRKRTFH